MVDRTRASLAPLSRMADRAAGCSYPGVQRLGQQVQVRLVDRAEVDQALEFFEKRLWHAVPSLVSDSTIETRSVRTHGAGPLIATPVPAGTACGQFGRPGLS